MRKEIYEEIKRNIYDFRNAIEKAKEDGLFVKDISFRQFPRACCGDASDLLGHYLQRGLELNMCVETIIVMMRKMVNLMRGYY